MLANTEYDKKELKRGNQGQTIGWKTNLKDPQFRLIQAVSGLLFDPADTRNRAYQEPEPMQTKAAVLAATRDQLLRLPGRVIGFAGDLTQDEANSLAKDLLPPVGAPPEGLDPVFLDLKGGRADTEVPLDNLTQIYFALAREGITYKDPDYASFLIANHVLGGHFFSRLYVALRHEGGETYGAYTSGGPSTQPEPYALSTFTRAENLSTTEEKLRKTLAVFHADGVTAVELEEAKSTLKGQLLFDQQAPGDVLDETLWELSLGLPAGFERQQAEAAAALTQDQVNGFIKRFYDPALFTMVKVVPKP